MLEQINASAEDQLKTQVIVALGLLAFGLFALATTATGGLNALTVIGVAAGGSGASMLRWAAQRMVLRPKVLATARA
jgi:hypothetical protein